MTVKELREQLAAGRQDSKRVVSVTREDWLEMLEAAQPSKPRLVRVFEELKQGAEGAAPALEVYIQANHVKAVLEALPPDFETTAL